MAEDYDWKKQIETQLAEQFAGTTIKWNGDNPTLVVPDELIAQSETIVGFATILFSEMGGEVKFYPDQAVHRAYQPTEQMWVWEP